MSSERAAGRAKSFAGRFGPWAVVTGASDGIGKEMARELASHGLSLVLSSRSEAKLASFANELEETFGIATKVLPADFSIADENRRLIAATESLDVGLLVAAAGYGTSGNLIDSDASAESGMVDLNCRAVLTQAQHFARRFAARRSGGIILLSSLVAFQGVARAANYAATKAYIQSLAEGLRIELRPYGVEVLASAPGPVQSGFATRAKMDLGNAENPAIVAKETVRALGRSGTVRPGLRAKLLEASLAFLPRSGRVRIMSAVMKGMTGYRHDLHQEEAARST